MSSEKFVRIEKLNILNDRTIIFGLSYSRHLKKYFSSDKLYIEYDTSIKQLDTSILYIPAVSSVVTVAWALGAGVYVDALDKTYLNSLKKIESTMKSWHPYFSCSTEINIENLVSNSFHNNEYGLLFTGGLDSVTSYIKHRHRQPRLVKIWGAEVAFEDTKSWKQTRQMLDDFTSREGARINIVRTNAPRITNKLALYRKFGLDWWPHISHSIVLTGSSAPFCCATGIGTLLIASSRRALAHPWGSHPELDNDISWADVKVDHDSFSLNRLEKIRYFLKDHIGNNDHMILKVCNNTQLPASNCGRCMKCLRTITGLTLEGVNPYRCGFNDVNSKTFSLIRQRFLKKRFFNRKLAERIGDFYDRIGETYHWKDLQESIPRVIENDLYGSKRFFEWFKSFDTSKYVQNLEKSCSLSVPNLLSWLYYECIPTILDHMPKSAQSAIDRLVVLLVDTCNRFLLD